MAHRRHQGAAGRAGDGRGRQPAADLHRPRDRRFQRAPEHPARALHPRGPRTRRSPTRTPATTSRPSRQAARRGRLPGQRHPPRRQRPGEPVRLDAVSDPNFSYWHSATSQRRHEGDLHRQVGRGRVRPLPRHRPAPVGRRRTLRHRGRGSMEFASYTRCRRSRPLQENCVAHNMSLVPVPGSRHLRAGLLPGRPVARRLQRHGQPGGDRLLRPRPDQHPEPDRAQPRWAVVDLLVQRPGLRQRDRPGVRHLRPRSQRPAQRERDRRGPGGRARRVQRPAPGHDDAGSRASRSWVPTTTRRCARASSPEVGRRAPPGSSRTRKRHADAGRTDAAASVLLEAADALPDTGDLGELQQALRDLAASLG